MARGYRRLFHRGHIGLRDGNADSVPRLKAEKKRIEIMGLRKSLASVHTFKAHERRIGTADSRHR